MWSYDDISIVVEVIKQGSFIEASRQLNIPASTISRRVNQLEDALGIRLLERTSRKLSLTDKGLLFFEACSPHIQGIKSELSELMTDQHICKGKLKVTAPVFLGSELLSEWFTEFMLENSQLELDVVLSNQYEDIVDESIDVAIRIGPLKDSQLIAQHLFSSHLVLCASPDFLKALKHPIGQLKDLAEQSMLLLEQHKSSLKVCHAPSNEQTELSLNHRVCSNDINIIRQAAMGGVGIACLPEMSVKQLIASGDLVVILTEYEIESKRDIYAVYPSRKHLSAKTRAFIDFMKARAKALND